MQRHEMMTAMTELGLKGMAGAFDEAVTTGLQRKRTVVKARQTPHSGLEIMEVDGAQQAGLVGDDQDLADRRGEAVEKKAARAGHGAKIAEVSVVVRPDFAAR